LAPVLAALGIAYLLGPVLERLVLMGMSRALGAGLLLLSFLGLIVGVLVLAIPAIATQVTEFADDLPRLATNLQLWLHDTFGVEIPADWKQYLNKENIEKTFGAAGPLGKLATAALGGVFSF